MGVNLDKPKRWKADIAASVDMYNKWFMEFAPKAFRDTRNKTTVEVVKSFQDTNNLQSIQFETLRRHPQILPTLRMSTCPPIAVDRLIGLAGVEKNLVQSMEKKSKIPPRMRASEVSAGLRKISKIITRMANPDIFVWLNRKRDPTRVELHRAATIVADRLCGAEANPIIRNAQEKRQLAKIQNWLLRRGYKLSAKGTGFDRMRPGTFSFRTNVPAAMGPPECWSGNRA